MNNASLYSWKSFLPKNAIVMSSINPKETERSPVRPAPRLYVLVDDIQSPMSEPALQLFEKMLKAIDLDIESIEFINREFDREIDISESVAVLSLDVADWATHPAGMRVHMIPHPERIILDSTLKREAWIVLKNLDLKKSSVNV